MITALQKMLILPVLLLFLVLGRNSAECQEVHIQKLSDVYGIRINDMLIDDNGDMLIGGKRGLYDFYIAKLDTSNFNILWDSAYSDPWCGNSYNEVFDVALHPQGGYLATVLIHECGTSNYDPGIYWFSEDGELLERTEYYMWTGFHQNHFGVNPFFRSIVVREDGNILSLYQCEGSNNNMYSILFEFDGNLNFVQLDTLNTGWTLHDLKLELKGERVFAHGADFKKYNGGFPYFAEIDPYTFEKKAVKSFQHDTAAINFFEVMGGHAYIAYNASAILPSTAKLFKYEPGSEEIVDSLVYSKDTIRQSLRLLNKIAENRLSFFRQDTVSNILVITDENLNILHEKIAEFPATEPGSYNETASKAISADSTLIYYYGQYRPMQSAYILCKATVSDLYSSVEDEQISSASIEIFPNPAREKLTIQYSNSRQLKGDIFYSLHDITGMKLMSGTIDRDITQLDISHLTSGLYFLVISEGKNRIYSETISKL